MSLPSLNADCMPPTLSVHPTCVLISQVSFLKGTSLRMGQLHPHSGNQEARYSYRFGGLTKLQEILLSSH